MLLDVTVCVVALAVLVVITLGLWRRVKALSATVGQAEELIGQATEKLASLQSSHERGRTTPEGQHSHGQR